MMDNFHTILFLVALTASTIALTATLVNLLEAIHPASSHYRSVD